MTKTKQKKSKDLGQPIEKYEQSRLYILIIFVVFIAFGSFLAYIPIQNPEKELSQNIIQTVLIFVLPTIVVAALLWFAIERLSPRKTLLLYSGGMRFVSKKGVKSYRWQDAPNVDMVISKDKHNDNVIQCGYTFRNADGMQVFKVDSGSFPGLEKKLTNVLKKVHVQGTVNLDTRVERIDTSG